MQKTVLVAQVAEQTGTSKRVAREIIDKTLEIISEQLQAGEKVVLTGFGTFQMRPRQQRKGVNPQTGQDMIIPAMQTPGFSASNNLRTRLVSSQEQENSINE